MTPQDYLLEEIIEIVEAKLKQAKEYEQHNGIYKEKWRRRTIFFDRILDDLRNLKYFEDADTIVHY